MSRPAAHVASILAVALVLAGCGDEPGGDEAPERCDVPYTVPTGFDVTGGIEDPYDDRIGVRVDMAGERRRELHYFAGIPGEFGEGLPNAGSLPAPDGAEGSLLGRHDVWAFVVAGHGCANTAVLGSGLDRRGFIAVLKEAGAVVA